MNRYAKNQRKASRTSRVSSLAAGSCRKKTSPQDAESTNRKTDAHNRESGTLDTQFNARNDSRADNRIIDAGDRFRSNADFKTAPRHSNATSRTLSNTANRASSRLSDDRTARDNRQSVKKERQGGAVKATKRIDASKRIAVCEPLSFLPGSRVVFESEPDASNESQWLHGVVLSCPNRTDDCYVVESAGERWLVLPDNIFPGLDESFDSFLNTPFAENWRKSSKLTPSL
jgi:hypothetical protein